MPALGRWFRSLVGPSPGRARPGPRGPTRTEPVDAANPADRAVAAFADLEQAFRVGPATPRYLEELPWRGGRACFLWPLSRVLGATLEIAALGARPVELVAAEVDGALAPYHRGGVTFPAYDSALRPPGGDRFYDDNAWVALDLIRLHELSASPWALERAAQLFAFLVAGWDGDVTRPRPGGVRWVESPANLDRNCVSTVPAAQLGYHLHRLTGDVEALRWADRMLGWASEVLRDPGDGLYADHIDADGRIEPTRWSYNQGSAVGAELAGFRARTKKDPERASRHLARAEATATAALDRYDAEGWAGQGLPFNAICFRNLLDLRRAIPSSPLAQRILAVATRHADEVWVGARGPDGLFRPDGGRVARVIDQGAAVELAAVVALAHRVRPSSPSGPLG